MNRIKRTSRLLDMARLVPAGQHLDDTTGMPAAEFCRTWRKLLKLKGRRGFLWPGRRGIYVADGVRRRERKRRERDPDRTYAERRARRRGWQ